MNFAFLSLVAALLCGVLSASNDKSLHGPVITKPLDKLHHVKSQSEGDKIDDTAIIKCNPNLISLPVQLVFNNVIDDPLGLAISSMMLMFFMNDIVYDTFKDNYHPQTILLRLSLLCTFGSVLGVVSLDTAKILMVIFATLFHSFAPYIIPAITAYRMAKSRVA